MIPFFYVDDLQIVAEHEERIKPVKQQLMQTILAIDMGIVKNCLGIKKRDRSDDIIISHPKHTDKISSLIMAMTKTPLHPLQIDIKMA